MTDTLLDFSLAPRRLESVRFDLMDEDLNVVGRVHPVGPPSLSVETARPVKRSLSGFSLLPSEAVRMGITTRVRPVWVLDDGSEYPCGVFILSDETMLTGVADDGLKDATLGDQMVLYREPLGRSFAIWPGDSILDKIAELYQLASRPAPAVRFDHITDLARTPASWPRGTVLSDALIEVAAMAGARVWFDRFGVMVIDRADPNPEPIDLSNPIEGSLKISYSNEDTPNRWVVRDNDQDFSLEGSYDLPPEAPHSFARRGRLVTREEVVPGLANADAADAAARDLALREPLPYKTATFEVPGRPDLECWDAVRLPNGQVFQVESISTELGPSGTTTVAAQALWDITDTWAYEPKASIEGSPVVGDVPPLNERILWDPAFLAAWRRMTPKQRRKLRAFLDAQAQAKAEAAERRRQRLLRFYRGVWRNRPKPPKRKPKAGRVTTADPESRIATVLLDGDQPGDEIVARLTSDFPGSEQRVVVDFGSPTPSVAGVIGGAQRMLGWAKGDPAGADQSLANGATTALRDTTIEVSVTQPGRCIVVFGQAMILNSASTVNVIGHIQRDDGDGGSFTTIGYFGQARTGVTAIATAYSGFAIDYLPDPGLYRYRLAVQIGGTGTGDLKHNEGSPHIMVVDMGGGREGTDDPYSTDTGAEKGGYGG